MVWIVNDMNAEFQKEIRKVQNTDLHRMYELATVKVWLENCTKHRGIPKRKNQFYINTTHQSEKVLFGRCDGNKSAQEKCNT